VSNVCEFRANIFNNFVMG